MANDVVILIIKDAVMGSLTRGWLHKRIFMCGLCSDGNASDGLKRIWKYCKAARYVSTVDTESPSVPRNATNKVNFSWEMGSRGRGRRLW